MLGLLAWTALPTWHGGYAFVAADIAALQFYLVCQILCLWFSVSGAMVACPFAWLIQRSSLPISSLPDLDDSGS